MRKDKCRKSYGFFLIVVVFFGLVIASNISIAESENSKETRIIVCYKNTGKSMAYNILTHRFHAQYIKEIPEGNLYVFTTTHSINSLSTDAELSKYIEYIEKDYKKHTSGYFIPNDTYWGYQWNYVLHQFPYAWFKELGESSVIVGHLDTGVQYTHPDLNGNVDESLGWDFAYGDSNPWDGDGHGTATAGIVCAEIHNHYGIAGGAQITLMPVKVLDDGGNGWTSDCIDGIYHAANNGAKVITMSYGSEWYSSSENTACNYAFNTRGVYLVAAAGNDGVNTPHYPASYSNVEGVGAVDSNGNRCPWSNWGSNVELMAAGEGVLTTYKNGDYAWVDGTSIACPHVAAGAALAFSFKPQFSNVKVRNKFRQFADDIGAPGYDPYTGYGLLDMWHKNG